MYYIEFVVFLFLKQSITQHWVAYLREVYLLSAFNFINSTVCNVISTYLKLDWQDHEHFWLI